jgi:hypothetical protein
MACPGVPSLVTGVVALASGEGGGRWGRRLGRLLGGVVLHVCGWLLARVRVVGAIGGECALAMT